MYLEKGMIEKKIDFEKKQWKILKKKQWKILKKKQWKILKKKMEKF